MKTAIIYASHHGTTAKIAEYISKFQAAKNPDLINVKKNLNPDLSQYSYIIIGGSIHASNIQSSIKKFCKKYEDDLLKKNLGLFLCCMNEPDFDKQFENAFPEKLRKHAVAHTIAGGEFLFEKMNFIERAIVKKVAKIKNTVSKINYSSIDIFLNDIYNK